MYWLDRRTSLTKHAVRITEGEATKTDYRCLLAELLGVEPTDGRTGGGGTEVSVSPGSPFATLFITILSAPESGGTGAGLLTGSTGPRHGRDEPIWTAP